MITMGVTAKDKITGFSGVVTGSASYISGCDQYLLSPKVDEKGEYKEGRWFDEQRLEVPSGNEMITLDNSNGNGADIPAPVK